ncbi:MULTISPECIES: copper resistance protein B [unclassified Nitratiruptor]|uniref:copper resistance protein B n=1 Tax=unclassified Nitratiruptor TaxID=2624044 RepID=UPI001916A780|nr:MULTISPECIES: copper resistance protein B [unclassified Nitratiruptor]BCD59809.1 copper resistance protein B [Nitratiruptor sp. YY08-10]BCD63733.1 copper resistance protein B [Nitratiruptor sp. YY08-14]
MKKFVVLLLVVTFMFAGGGDIFRYQMLVDQFEASSQGKPSWDASFFMGYDANKIYLYSEGDSQEQENEIVFSHTITPFFDLQIGMEHDTKDKGATFGEITLMGLAPYFIETRTKLLFGEGGVGIDFDFEYETLFTQRLILNSRVESRIFSKDIEKAGIFQGLNDITVGFRLRYEIQREFAPYIGYSITRNFGGLKREEGQVKDRFVVGIRFWF